MWCLLKLQVYMISNFFNKVLINFLIILIKYNFKNWNCNSLNDNHQRIMDLGEKKKIEEKK